jgi:hypothetical protein
MATINLIESTLAPSWGSTLKSYLDEKHIFDSVVLHPDENTLISCRVGSQAVFEVKGDGAEKMTIKSADGAILYDTIDRDTAYNYGCYVAKTETGVWATSCRSTICRTYSFSKANERPIMAYTWTATHGSSEPERNNVVCIDFIAGTWTPNLKTSAVTNGYSKTSGFVFKNDPNGMYAQFPNFQQFVSRQNGLPTVEGTNGIALYVVSIDGNQFLTDGQILMNDW